MVDRTSCEEPDCDEAAEFHVATPLPQSSPPPPSAEPVGRQNSSTLLLRRSVIQKQLDDIDRQLADERDLRHEADEIRWPAPNAAVHVHEAMRLLSPEARARCKGKHVGRLGTSSADVASATWNATWSRSLAWNKSAAWWFMVVSRPLDPTDEKSRLYLQLTKVAVLSARAFAGASLYPHLVYLSGTPDAFTAWMEAHGVHVILHNLSFWEQLPNASHTKRLASGLTFGTFGKRARPNLLKTFSPRLLS